jgi:16S rRNA (guanine966-N2)-methyltransferase
MAKTVKSGRSNSVRIISGRLKGRRIPIDSDVIRPTADRVRETLFNWLDPYLRGARCLDMFAGSGALGIEAWSRGASSLSFVERDRRAAQQLRLTLSEFGCTAKVHQLNAAQLDYSTLGPFDIVFLDPPFDGPDMSNLCTLLESSGGLCASALIYIEMHRKSAPADLPSGWEFIKERTAGQVRFALAKRTVLSD